jgi:Trk K+ transport system NAD-binding subunit
MELLRNRQYPGKIAVAASTEEEVKSYEHAGVDLVLRPFIDAAEQAVDALSYAMDVLPHDVHWPVSFLEVRIRSDAAFAGHSLKEIPLRSTTGVSVLAVSRAGRLDYDPGPDFRIHPGDRLIIVGPPAGLREAEMMLNQLQLSEETVTANRFEIAEIRIADDSALAGKTFDTLRIRQQYGVTVVGIQRAGEQITNVRPTERIEAKDCLIVIGTSAAIEAVRASAPL